MGKETVEVLVEGGKATAAPPIGPILSPLKINVGQVVTEINEKTKGFAGMQVPVKIVVDTETKKFTISVGSPPVSALIKKEMKVQKLAFIKEGNKTLPGDIKLSSVISVAKSKEIPGSLNARVKQVLGTCLSGGVTIDGRNPKEIIAEINSGKIKIE
jgi:large subunit ribosomal protein L11